MAVSRLLDGKGGVLGGAIGRNLTNRSRAGSKKSILVDGGGGPLSVVVAGANVHDTKLLRLTLESIVVRWPESAQDLCLDQGYDNPTGHETAADTGYQSHIGRIGEEKLDQSGKNPIQPGGGWWNAPWDGGPSGGPYWCDRPKGHPITLACSNWLLLLSGTAAVGASLF